MQSNKSTSQLAWKLLVILATAIQCVLPAQADENEELVGRKNTPVELNLNNIAPLAVKAREVVSDLLIVLDSDGRSYTAQHTIGSNGPEVSVRLPGSVAPQEVLIFDSTLSAQQKLNSLEQNSFLLTNGVALARYQHQYGTEVAQTSASSFTLTAASVPASVETDSLSRSAITWVFPTDHEIVSYTNTPEVGYWVIVDNTLTFRQISGKKATLSIDYKQVNRALPTPASACTNVIASGDDCADDIDEDEDGIPDYIDVCKSDVDQTTNVYGCPVSSSMLLESVIFNTGRTYLNVAARATLDKLAHALIKHNANNVEIGAHTDNEGAASSNLQLSKKRADAVRHYLILRGVDPNKITAAGYGEQYPIRENTSADGRRANRRVELVFME